MPSKHANKRKKGDGHFHGVTAFTLELAKDYLQLLKFEFTPIYHADRLLQAVKAAPNKNALLLSAHKSVPDTANKKCNTRQIQVLVLFVLFFMSFQKTFA